MIATMALHELRVLFRSRLAWIAAGLLQLVFGWMFLSTLESYLLAQSSGQSALVAKLGLTSVLAANWLQPVAMVFFVASPMICMQLIAEERKSGRYQLLASSPLSAFEIAMGKFLGATVFQYLVLLINVALAFSLHIWTGIDSMQLLCAALGLCLVVALTTAISLFFSSLFNQPVVAGICSLILLLMLWLFASGTGLMQQISPLVRAQGFFQGVISVGDIAYFVAGVASLIILSTCRLKALSAATPAPV